MPMRICAALVLMLSVLPCLAQGADATPSPKQYTVKVSLTMSGDNEYRGQVEDYLSRKLGAIHDVKIVDRGDEDVCIYCIVLAAKFKDQTTMGVVLSYAVTSQTKNIVGKFAVSRLVHDTYHAAEISQYFTNGGYLVDQFTSISDVPSLRETVSSDADRIDSSDIKLVRDIYAP
jgi:hypothetical protein